MKLTRNSSGGFQDLLQDLREAGEDSVEIGWFKEQGLHHSGLTYPDLARVHNNGVRVPKRDILGLSLFLHSPHKDPTVKAFIKEVDKEERCNSSGAIQVSGTKTEE